MSYPNDEAPIVSVVARQYRDAHRETGTMGTLVQTARVLFENQGVAATPLAAVARAAHVSRTLLYYYFSSKDELVEAALNDCAEDFVDSISLWNESRVFGHTPQELANFSKTLRRTLYDADGAERPIVRMLDELGCRDEFMTRVLREAVSCIFDQVVSEYAAYHSIEIRLVPEMFCVVLAGIARPYKVKPDISDEDVSAIIAQTLRLDMRVIDEPEWRESRDD